MHSGAAIAAGVIVFVESVLFFIYVGVTSTILRKKMVKMGRLIPSMPMMVMSTTIIQNAPQGIQVQDQSPYQNVHMNPAYPPPPAFSQPPAAGWQEPQADLPPPYTAPPHKQ